MGSTGTQGSGDAPHPIFSKHKIGDYLELHIEQSRNVALNEAEVGISEGDIGGARREKFVIPLEPEEIEVKPGAYKKINHCDNR